MLKNSDIKDDPDFGENPYKKGGLLKLGRWLDVYHYICALQYQADLSGIFTIVRNKLRVPVFTILGTNDFIVA